MAKKKLVKCPYCGKMIDRDLEFDWSKHSNRYWHDDCWEANKNKPNEKDAVIKKAVEVLGMYADYKLINVQLNQLLKSGYTAEGIIQSLEYFYNVQGNNPNKSNGGIGVFNIYRIIGGIGVGLALSAMFIPVLLTIFKEEKSYRIGKKTKSLQKR